LHTLERQPSESFAALGIDAPPQAFKADPDPAESSYKKVCRRYDQSEIKDREGSGMSGEIHRPLPCLSNESGDRAARVQDLPCPPHRD
jgi:hypothetical protein